MRFAQITKESQACVVLLRGDAFVWVLVEIVDGRCGEIARSLEQYMTREGALEEGLKAAQAIGGADRRSAKRPEFNGWDQVRLSSPAMMMDPANAPLFAG